MTKIINLIGGPGSGKSTLAHGVMALLKSNPRIRAEYVPECAKELVWDGLSKRDLALAQGQIVREQERRLRRLIGKVDVAVQDTSLLLGLYYGRDHLSDDTVLSTLRLHDSYDNFNVFVCREKEYMPHGRVETESEALAADQAIRSLYDGRIDCTVPGDSSSPHFLYRTILAELGR